MKVSRKQNSLFPSGSVIECLITFDYNMWLFIEAVPMTTAFIICPYDILNCESEIAKIS